MSRVARTIRMALMLALLAVVRPSWAELPGSMRLSASGGDHLWWVVKVEPEPDRTRSSTTAAEPTFALMHHAVDEPAPSERLVMRFAHEPLALAAEGERLVIVSRGESEGSLYAVTLFAARNPAIGHWYTVPQGAPFILPAPPAGDIRAIALAGDRLHLLLRLRRTDPRDADRHWFGALPCESGSGSVWTEMPVPQLDMVEPVRLVGRASGVVAIGSDGGAARLARLESDRWWSTPLDRDLQPLDPRAMIGAFVVSGRIALVERVVTPSGGSRIQVGFVGEGEARMSARRWAEFEEPAAPWSIGPLGGQGAIVEILERGRGQIRALALASDSPAPPTDLSPPGFASGNWIHLPILAAISVIFVLVAVIFGADAYLERRLAIPPDSPARLFRGAGLSKRGTAFFIDMLPGIVLIWLLKGGSPFELLEIPALQTDISRSGPAVAAFSMGWIVATIGDIGFGRSLGKRVMGLLILNPQGDPATLGRRALRSLLSLISVASPLVMLLALLHPRGDGPAEMLSKTAVADEEALEAVRGRASGDNDAA